MLYNFHPEMFDTLKIACVVLTDSVVYGLPFTFSSVVEVEPVKPVPDTTTVQ